MPKARREVDILDVRAPPPAAPNGHCEIVRLNGFPWRWRPEPEYSHIFLGHCRSGRLPAGRQRRRWCCEQVVRTTRQQPVKATGVERIDGDGHTTTAVGARRINPPQLDRRFALTFPAFGRPAAIGLEPVVVRGDVAVAVVAPVFQ